MAAEGRAEMWGRPKKSFKQKGFQREKERTKILSTASPFSCIWIDIHILGIVFTRLLTFQCRQTISLSNEIPFFSCFLEALRSSFQFSVQTIWSNVYDSNGAASYSIHATYGRELSTRKHNPCALLIVHHRTDTQRSCLPSMWPSAHDTIQFLPNINMSLFIFVCTQKNRNKNLIYRATLQNEKQKEAHKNVI